MRARIENMVFLNHEDVPSLKKGYGTQQLFLGTTLTRVTRNRDWEYESEEAWRSLGCFCPLASLALFEKPGAPSWGNSRCAS